MAVDRRISFYKQPSEEFDIEIDFSQTTPLGSQNLLSASATVIKWPRKNPNNISIATNEVLFSNIGVIATSGDCFCGQSARFRVLGGISGYDYKITVLGVFDDNSKIEDDIFMRIRED